MNQTHEVKMLRVFNGKTAPKAKPVEWLVEKLLARGAGTLIFGQPGAKKTVHAAHLVACLVAGKPFAHLKTIQRGLRVMYLDFDGSWEWNQSIYEAAFRGIGMEGLPESFIYYSPNTEECIDPGDTGLQALESLGPAIELTIRNLEIDLVVCDSLGQMMVGDTNHGQDVALALRLGLNPARKAGAAVLVIDHATKSAAGGGGVPTPMGSQQKRAWARVSVALEKEEGQGSDMTRWSIDKSNTAPFEPFLTQIEFVDDKEKGQLHTLRMHPAGSAGERVAIRDRAERGQTVQQDILKLLEAGPTSRAALGSGGTCDRALSALLGAGQAIKLGRGLYGLPVDRPLLAPPTVDAPGGEQPVLQDGAAPTTWTADV
jgi:AAA domain